MHAARIASVVLGALGVTLLFVAQFVPYASYEDSSPGGTFGGFTVPGFRFEISATPWSAKSSAGGESESHSWYDSQADDTDGVGLIRAGAPILAAGLALGAVGVLLVGLLRGAGGPLLTLVGAVLAATATVLLSIGMDQAFQDADYNWHVGFYFAIFGSALVLGAAIAGFMAPRGATATA